MIKIDNEFKNLIPPLTGEEYNTLRDSIKSEGVRDAVVLWNDIVIDGHNRYSIATELGIDFKTASKEFESRDKVKEWIILNQFGRRNLTPFQRAELALVYKGLFVAKAKENLSLTGGDKKSGCQNSDKPIINPIDTKKEISKIADVSHDTIYKVEKIKAKATDETINKVRSGNISINEAFKQVKTEEKKKEIEDKKIELDIEALQQPEGLFDVIVIDPPWNYGTQYNAGTRRVANPYPEMTTEEISNIELPAKDDCVLYLWATHKYLFEAKKIMDNWGFEYKATLVWNKEQMGMGDWFRMQCEFCLVGIKGKPLFANQSERDIINEQRREHSRKPEAFYEMVNRLNAGRKLDYFSRTSRDGWSVYGNETNKFYNELGG